MGKYVQGVSVINITQTTARVTWTNPTDPGLQYIIVRCADAIPFDSGHLSPTTTFYDLYYLGPNRTLSVDVITVYGGISYNNQGNLFTTQTCLPPASFQQVGLYLDKIVFKWTNPEMPYPPYLWDQFIILFPFYPSQSNAIFLPSTSTGYTYTGVTNILNVPPDYSHKFNIALSLNASLFYAQEITGTTASATPYNLTVTGTSLTSIGVAWTNPITGYTNTKTQYYNGSTWVDVATLAGNATAYNYVNLSPNTSYILRVAGLYNGVWYYSNQITQSTDSLAHPILTGALDVDHVNLDWTDSNVLKEHYEIWKRETTNFPYISIQSYWNFNEVSGTTVHDSTVNLFNGTFNGTFVAGKINNGGYFGAATNKNVNFGQVYKNERTQAYSISCWVKRNNTTGAWQGIISNTVANSPYNSWIDIFLYTDNKLWFRLIGNSAGNSITQITNSAVMMDTNWHNLVCTYDGSSLSSGLKIYIDGVLIPSTGSGTLNTTTISPSQTQNLYIGNRVGTTQNFKGIIDEFGLWSRVLTSGETINLYNGGNGVPYSAFMLLNTVDYPTQNYVDYAVDSGDTYTYKVRDKLDSYSPVIYSFFSNEITVPTNLIGPTGLTSTNITYTGATINWVNNNVSGVTGNYVQRLANDNVTWNTIATVASGDTSYNLTGLTPNTLYYFRIEAFNNDGTAASSRIGITTLDPTPYDLQPTTVTLLYVDIAWTLPVLPYGTSIDVRIKKTSESIYNTIATLAYSATTYRILNLLADTSYDCIVVKIGSEFPSIPITFITPQLMLPTSFCGGNNYTVNNATCGNSNGSIQIPNQNYVYYYDFTLTDISGNTYTLTLDSWTGLTASWYFLTATPKPQYVNFFNEGTCSFEWIPLEDSNTTIILNATKIRNAICGGFGGSKGRIVYQFIDSASGATSWTFSLYNDQHQLVNTQSLTGITNIQYIANSDIYYGILENNLGCTYLIDLTFVDAEKLFTVEGIQRLFLTPWSSAMSYDYYDNTSDDWYVAGIDTQQFTSTKIARYSNLPDFWYEIRLDTATMTYAEVLQKGSNGLTYQETVTITIPHADNAKWKQLVNILTQRYILVFEDNNGNWWTCFYRNGAEVKAYGLAENQYTITFQHPSVNKMLTAIDYAYVKLAIL